MTTLTMDIPEKVMAVMRCPPEDMKKEIRLAAAVTWYEQGKVSQEIAAQVAEMDRTDFLLALSRLGKDSFRVDCSDLDKELARG